jgi:putative Ca2+/H+ antiporter (TMEM165/GDT1 family)
VDLLVVALTFGAIFVVELPDKTFIATLVLSTRYRGIWVWVGVGLAFGVQTAIAVALGTAATLLPVGLVRGIAVGLFLFGAVVLLREARSNASLEDELSETEAEQRRRATSSAGGLRAVGASFLVLFAAEWGDLSQLLTLSLVARYQDPVSVFVGAWAALLTVSALAVLLGKLLLRRIPVHTLQYVGAGVCLVLAALTAYELLA